MEQRLLTPDDILNGYQELAQLYPFIPSALIWRAWEFAAYRQYQLQEPVLDLGCGDGHFFRFVWPDITDVIGIDHEPGVVAQAEQSGVYREVYTSAAQALPFEDETFASVFANCSLEHMDELPDVLQQVYRCLRPGGGFLLSVVTNKFVEWITLSTLVQQAGAPEQSHAVHQEYLDYHHLISALEPEAWATQFSQAGFELDDHIPIVPELTGRLFLFIDQFWHFKTATGEWGAELPKRFASWPNFSAGLATILRGVLLMESNWQVGCGAVFRVHKPL